MPMNETPESEPPAPWVKYPESYPSWGGFRQGTSQAWFNEVWLPFWQSIDENGKSDFLKRFPPPSDEGWPSHLEQCCQQMMELQRKGWVNSGNQPTDEQHRTGFLGRVWRATFLKIEYFFRDMMSF